MPDISIIISTKERGNILLKTIDHAVEASAHVDAEILVINNCGSPPIIIPNKPFNVSVYDNPANPNSVFASKNYGVSLAKAPILLFLDDDILIFKTAIDYAFSFHREHKQACFNLNWEYPPLLTERISKTIFGSFLIKHGFSSLKNIYDKSIWKDNAPFISPWVASYCLCIKKEDFLKTGGYDEKQIHEGSDLDISNKLKSHSISMWINPLIMVYHNEEDRMDLGNWLKRKKRLGAIQHNSFILGEAKDQLHYPPFKRFAYTIIYALQPLFLATIRMLDAMHIKFGGFILINMLLGANMCKGYSSIKE